MRALWTSASGMTAMQTKLDTVANNLANVGTTAYKSQDVQFKDALYAQFVQKPEVTALPGRQTTPGLRIGHGIVPVAMRQTFAQGSLQETKNTLDVAIDKENGFIRMESTDAPNVQVYTRDGSFKAGVKDNQLWLENASGRRVLGTNNQPISLQGYDLESLKIDEAGRITANQNGAVTAVGQIQLVAMANPGDNLEPAGNNLYSLKANALATQVLPINQVAAADRPHHRQGFVEASNVDMAGQMTEMIVAQRAYSMNARAIQTVDQMMGMANNLRNG
jgi:flagellar basal-body rod protein FlgG